MRLFRLGVILVYWIYVSILVRKKWGGLDMHSFIIKTKQNKKINTQKRREKEEMGEKEVKKEKEKMKCITETTLCNEVPFSKRFDP